MRKLEEESERPQLPHESENLWNHLNKWWDNKRIKPEYNWDKEPYIVVSDIHLGGANSNAPDFLEFINWIRYLPSEGKTLECDGTLITIKKPGTIVLLGDILEFWDPKEDDRCLIWKQALHPLSILSDLDCDLIYVLGNHDQDLYDIYKVWLGKVKKEGKEACLRHDGNGKFRIFYRNFPESTEGEYKGSFKPIIEWLKRQPLLKEWKFSPIIEGKKIGNHTYCFLHGHQFDRLQIPYKISNIFHVRFDPIDYFQDLANINFTKNVGKLNTTTLYFSALFIGYLLYSILHYSEIKSSFTWIFVSFFFAATLLPKIITKLATEVWPWVESFISKKNDLIENVVKDRYRREKGDRIKADTIVFGHTHIPGHYFDKSLGKSFYNTGCWVNDTTTEKSIPNTFLYIEKEPYLLKWDEKISTAIPYCPPESCLVS